MALLAGGIAESGGEVGFAHHAAPGIGKSHLAQALGLEAIRAGLSVYYRSIFDLVRDLRAEVGADEKNRLLSRADIIPMTGRSHRLAQKISVPKPDKKTSKTQAQTSLPSDA